jgi:phosphoribosylformylglycinamidine synthase
MWQFAEAARGLKDGCERLGTPVTGGNVSFYNQTGDTAILPTPVVGVLGVIDDVARRVPHAFATPGQAIYLLGETRDEFGGSEWAHVMHGHLGGLPPAVDLDAERTIAEILTAAARDNLVSAAHDLSDGGLAAALTESVLRGGVGATVSVPEGLDPFVFLFAESQSRVIVAVGAAEEQRFTALCTSHSYPAHRIGVVGGESLTVNQWFTVGLDELRTAHEGTLVARFA